LRRDIPVIPVLVQGAAMPGKEELLPDLEVSAWHNTLVPKRSWIEASQDGAFDGQVGA
jgi:hypothetical protein